MKVTVVGMGYVGCVTATCLARDGNEVIGIDIDKRKVDSINAGVPPVFEPGLAELLKEQVASGRVRATTDILDAVANSDAALIAVGTPSADDGSVNYKTVKRVIEGIGEILKDSDKRYVVVVRSTLLPGVLEEVLAPALSETAGCPLGDRIQICNNPEFLRETTAIRDYDQPPFILIGADSASAAEMALELYRGIDCERIVTSTRVASMVKYASNAYHALKIAFANEIGTLAKTYGADGQKVMEVVCKDTQLNVSKAYLRPGYAFGGSCLPKDVRALVRYSEQHGQKCDLLQSILPSNRSHLERSLKLIRESGKKRVGLIGLSFKAGTDDLRESPQVFLAETLLGQGFDISIYDPDVRVTALVGSNLHFIDEHLPHLAKLLCTDSTSILERDLLIIATGVANRLPGLATYKGQIIDLRKDLVVAR